MLMEDSWGKRVACERRGAQKEEWNEGIKGARRLGWSCPFFFLPSPFFEFIPAKDTNLWGKIFLLRMQ